MIKATLAALAALGVSACALGMPLIAQTPEVELAKVAKFECVTQLPTEREDGVIRSMKKTGTVTRVGDAKITAAHVVKGCIPSVEAIIFPEIDLAILEAAPMDYCRLADVGERVTFHGYPVTEQDGEELKDEVVLESHHGRVKEHRVPHMLTVNPDGGLDLLVNHTRVEAPFLRGGYSGGPTVNVETGEFLGIISTGAMWRDEGSFIPADIICEKMEEVL